MLTGQTIGPYRIVDKLGAGGMGEVYRARDTKLNRDVAIKVLPDLFAGDPERLARFTREAQTLAALNHPNIAHIHGLEESSGVRALAMELVEGPTLEERLRAPGSGLPLNEALDIARQIAEALEAAHEQGIIHRDLKPANIKVREDGTVKVLDFGLAKALESGAGSRTAYGGAAPADSPTLTTPAATLAGVILGTAAYMAPEQARGKPVDKRADIWAFGVVLFEMVTGTRAFEGELISDVLASVLKTDPDWQVVPAATPVALRKLLRRCLEKDPKRRLQAIGEARIQIEDLLKGAPEETAPSPPAPSHDRTVAPPPPRGITRVLPWAAAALASLAAMAMLMAWAPWKKTPPPASVRMTTDLGADVTLVTNVGASAVLSPDGSVMVFTAGTNVDCGCPSADSKLYVRHLDQLRPIVLAGTDGAAMPFFSPDGQWVGFFANGRLMKVSVTGGAPIALCDAPNGRGGTWGADGNIVFTPNNGANINLMRVSAAGGKPEPLIPLEQGEVTQRWPQLLPGGAVVYTSNAVVGANTATAASANLVVKRLPNGERKILQHDAVFGRYLPSGHLIYLHDSTLFAVPFDVDKLELTGQPVPVIDGVFASPATSGGQFSASDTGTLVYLPGNEVDAAVVPISWMDRTGKTTALRATPTNWTDVRFSPDGRRLAMDISDGKQRDIWIYEWARDTLSRLTFDPTDDSSPVWTPDGTRIAFASKRGGGGFYNLYWQRADGTGEVQRLSTSPMSHQIPESWDPSGRLLAFHDIPHTGGGDLMILPISGSEAAGWKPGTPQVFLKTPATEANPMFSPDGRWLAYESNESGQNEIYVRPYPGPGGKWQISTAGGTYATWSPTKHELFYGTPDQHLMVVPWAADGTSFRAEKPALWSDTRFAPGLYRRYDIHPDGQRFAVSKDPKSLVDPKQDKVVFVFNFFDELRRLAPLKK